MLSKLKKLGLAGLLCFTVSCYSKMHKPDQYAANNNEPPKVVQVQEDIYSQDKDMIALLEGLINEETKKRCRDEKLDSILKDKVSLYHMIDDKRKKTGKDYSTLSILEAEVEILGSDYEFHAIMCIPNKKSKINGYRSLIKFYKERRYNNKLF